MKTKAKIIFSAIILFLAVESPGQDTLLYPDFYPGGILNSSIYVGAYNGSGGGQLWRSSDGVNFEVVRADGFGETSSCLKIKPSHDVFNGYITILHDNGMISHYGHVSDILVYEEDFVKKGQSIARINRQVDKYSTGPHLDFRLQNIEGEYVNPLLWIGE